jgi:hypothetical protein
MHTSLSGKHEFFKKFRDYYKRLIKSDYFFSKITNLLVQVLIQELFNCSIEKFKMN